MLTRRHFLAATAAAIAATGAAPASAGMRTLSGPAFGSRWHAVLPPEADEARFRHAVETVVARTDAMLSPYRADSVLSRFNRSRSSDWAPVPREMATLAETSQQLHRATAGAFDPTVGPLVRRFGFGPIEGRPAPFEALETGPGRIRKLDPALTLDLCGIAKGRALDQIVSMLRNSFPDFLLELGGEVLARGSHPDGRAWQLGVETPLPGHHAVHRVILPRGRAVATSGHAAQGFGTISHLIDPRRARPADTRLASVTVLEDSAERADALATALAALGPEDGSALAAAGDIDALFLFAEGGRITEQVTGGFADYILA